MPMGGSKILKLLKNMTSQEELPHSLESRDFFPFSGDSYSVELMPDSMTSFHSILQAKAILGLSLATNGLAASSTNLLVETAPIYGRARLVETGLSIVENRVGFISKVMWRKHEVCRSILVFVSDTAHETLICSGFIDSIWHGASSQTPEATDDCRSFDDPAMLCNLP